MKILKKLLRKLFEAVYAGELAQMRALHQDMKEDYMRIHQMLGNLDVSVDVHLRGRSWAVLSLQGKKTDFIKFIDLGDRDICEIQKFLRTFDREQVKIDANPFIAMGMKDHLLKIGKDELY